MNETIATIGGIAGAASVAVLWRLVTQQAFERIFAHLLFKGLYWVSKRSTNTLDNELVEILENSYNVKGTDSRNR